ncbi:MAG: hypothetical protein GY765_03925 [bacterium]|nr:hypothetical protein [bacterium]
MKLKKIYVSLNGLLCLVLVSVVPFLFMGCVTSGYRPIESGLPDMEGLKTYFIRQKQLSWGDQFTIENEDREPMFFVKGKVFTIGAKLSFRDMEGNQVIYIKEKVKILNFSPYYRIYKDGQLIADVKKSPKVFKDIFTIRVTGGPEYKAKGNFSNHQFKFTSGGRDVAFVSKKHYTYSDKYRVEVGANEDEIIILASAIIIDMVCHNEEDNHSLLDND